MAQSTSATAPAQPESLRLFFGLACPVNAAIRQQLQALQRASADPRNGLLLVPEANLHITLKFLGACQPSLVPILAQLLDEACRETHAFTLQLRGAGSFHGALWLGLDAHAGLAALTQRLEAATQTLGFSADSKPWQPHLTLARLNQKPGFASREWQQQLREVDFGALAVERVNLYQSTTLPTGAIYRVLHSAVLADG